MRLFQNFQEAQNEIKRDLAELAILVHPETMQDKDVAEDPDYVTHELQNYSYTVLQPRVEDIEGVHQEWLKQEWEDRLQGDLNPGKAWKTRPEVWKEFIEKWSKIGQPGGFSYSYSDRMGGVHIERLIEEIKVHPHSRQLWLPVWDRLVDEQRRGQRRVPCSLGYWFVNRGDQLHVTYIMRSCDFVTHYPNDLAVTTLLLQHVAAATDLKVGTFSHFVGSFHVYAKDVEGVF